MSKGVVKQFYCTKPWVHLRDNLIIKRHMTCERCGRHFTDTSMLIGHHKTELNEDNINDPNITLNEDNIEIICFDCHNKEHRRFGYNEKNVYIVYGPPLCNAKRFVQEVSKPGDLIVDMDMLYQAVSGQPLYIKPNNLRFNVFRLKDTLIDNVKTRYGQWCDAYIIGGYPEKFERDRLQQELHADIVYCEMSKEECYRQVELQARSKDWYGYIDKWFDNYS